MGGQHFPDGVLELLPRLDPAPDVLHPIFGDVLHALLPFDHEGEQPDGVAVTLGAEASGLAATQVTE